jgi:hypothetical protein
MLANLTSHTNTVPYCSLLVGSPAIDAGDDSVLTPPWTNLFDVCGMIRLADEHVDMGACEFNGSTNLATRLTIERSGIKGVLNLILKGNPSRIFDIESTTNFHQWTKTGTVTNFYIITTYPVTNTPPEIRYYRAEEIR